MAMKNRPHFKIVEEMLARNIADGRLPAGTQLMASGLAKRLDVSRAPATRALKELAARGLIVQIDGYGYMVCGQGATTPVRRNLHELDFGFDLDQTRNEALVAPSWERILQRVENDILNCTPFGTFMISETGLGQHFEVGRSVVREVLSRLHGRRLIRKDRQSHWIAGPLSARMLNQGHEMRRQLEPLAIASAIPDLSRTELAAMRETVRVSLNGGLALSPEQMESIEVALHCTCVNASRNHLLIDMVKTVQYSGIVNRLFANYIGVHDTSAILSEHRLVFDHMLIGDRGGTEVALRFHLDADHERSIARLKVLSIFDAPETASYLARIY
jgi:DNA-binding GntR family transcriptional regulator